MTDRVRVIFVLRRHDYEDDEILGAYEHLSNAQAAVEGVEWRETDDGWSTGMFSIAYVPLYGGTPTDATE